MMSLLKMQWTKMNKVFRDMSTYSVVYNLSKSFPSTGHRKYKLTGTFVWIIIKTDFFFFFTISLAPFAMGVTHMFWMQEFFHSRVCLIYSVFKIESEDWCTCRFLDRTFNYYFVASRCISMSTTVKFIETRTCIPIIN